MTIIEQTPSHGREWPHMEPYNGPWLAYRQGQAFCRGLYDPSVGGIIVAECIFSPNVPSCGHCVKRGVCMKAEAVMHI